MNLVAIGLAAATAAGGHAPESAPRIDPLEIETASAAAPEAAIAADAPAETSPDFVEGATTVSAEQAFDLYMDGAAFVDVRAGADYEAGRIPEAVSLHVLSEAFTEDALLAVAGKSEPLLVYCNGAYCQLSSKAAEAAIGWGFERVYYFRGGYPAWEAAGFPIE